MRRKLLCLLIHPLVKTQNLKKRGVPFAQMRLEVRTNSNTFFSSVKSIRGYRCVKLFVHLLTQFLCISNIWSENHNHRTYQDYIREARTPNNLLKDNANSQLGKQWTETSWNNKTQQIMSAHDKQNQDTSGRNVNDVKHRVDYTLFASKSPIIFWCYCMQYVVYCLNLTAWRRLNYITSTDTWTGVKPDISHLKFTFWQKAWYHDYNGNFPSSPWKPYCVIIFAYHQGGQLTYKIWIVDKNDIWEDIRELTLDILLLTKVSNHETPDTSLLTLQHYERLQVETLLTRL